jgi:hypothetical protein
MHERTLISRELVYFQSEFQKTLCIFMGSILQGKFVHVKMNKYHFLTKIVHALGSSFWMLFILNNRLVQTHPYTSTNMDHTSSYRVLIKGSYNYQI